MLEAACRRIVGRRSSKDDLVHAVREYVVAQLAKGGGCVATTGAVRLSDEGKGQIDESKLVLDVGHGGSSSGNCVDRPWLPWNPAEC